MRKIMLALTAVLMLTGFTGCKKKKQYTLTFTCKHWWTQGGNSSDIGNGFGTYSLSVTDKKFDDKFDKTENIENTTETYTTTGESGDYVYVSVSVSDVYDYATAKCTDQSGNIVAIATTDNLYIDDDSGFQQLEKKEPGAEQKPKTKTIKVLLP